MLAVSIGLVVFVIGQFIGLSASVSIVFAIGIIVANVPEGLLPTRHSGDGHGARRMAGTLVRHLPSVETLGSASVICTDKTGTLTQNRMEIRSVCVPGGPIDPATLEHRRSRRATAFRMRILLPRFEERRRVVRRNGLATRWSLRWCGWRTKRLADLPCWSGSTRSRSTQNASAW